MIEYCYGGSGDRPVEGAGLRDETLSERTVLFITLRLIVWGLHRRPCGRNRCLEQIMLPLFTCLLKQLFNSQKGHSQRPVIWRSFIHLFRSAHGWHSLTCVGNCGCERDLSFWLSFRCVAEKNHCYEQRGSFMEDFLLPCKVLCRRSSEQFEAFVG